MTSSYVAGASPATLRLDDERQSALLIPAGEGGTYEVRRRRGHRRAYGERWFSCPGSR